MKRNLFTLAMLAIILAAPTLGAHHEEMPGWWNQPYPQPFGAGDLEHRPGNSRQHATDRGCRRVRQLVQERRPLLGNHQGVTRNERPDVEERQDVLVLVEDRQ
mgnify:CR=1 FL=1